MVLRWVLVTWLIRFGLLIAISLSPAFQLGAASLPWRLSPDLRAAASQKAHIPLRELTSVRPRAGAAVPGATRPSRPCFTVRLGGAGPVIDYRLRGPLEVSANSRAIDIGGLKQRALLAILLLRANQPVSRDVLVHQLWGDGPPAGAQHSLEVYISRLRKTLEPAAGGQVVLTRPGAYLLRVAADHIDINP